jgi:hypothetical protein
VVWSNQRTWRLDEFQVLLLSRNPRYQDGVAWVRYRDSVHIYRYTYTQEKASRIFGSSGVPSSKHRHKWAHAIARGARRTSYTNRPPRALYCFPRYETLRSRPLSFSSLIHRS